MQNELHIMLDIETLGPTVILDVGYAIFDTHGNGIQSSGAWLLDYDEQVKSGIQGDTLRWWLKQSLEAQEQVFHHGPRYDPASFAENFLFIIDWHNLQGVWAFPTHFDLPILENFLRKHNTKIPWDFGGHLRCYDMGTLVRVSGFQKEERVKPAFAHMAEHDAVAQALTVQLALRRLRDAQF